MKITSSDVAEDGLLYVNGTLYNGYYMDEAGLMFKVSDGVYKAYSGSLMSKTSYYQAGSGTATLSVGMVYASGEAYTGYYKTGSYMYYTDATSGYAKYTGLIGAGRSYISSADQQTYQTTSSLYYVDGVPYTGYWMTLGGVMYTAKDGVYSQYSGNIVKGTSYYKDGTGTQTLSLSLIYASGKVYTGYYKTGSYMYYTDATSGYAKHTGLIAAGRTYISAADQKSYTTTSTLFYVNGVLYTGYWMTGGNVMYKVSNGVYSKYSGSIPSGTSYYKDGTGTVTTTVGLVFASGKVYTGYYKTGTYMYYVSGNSGYAKYTGCVSSGSTYISSADQETYTTTSNLVYVGGLLYTGYYMTTTVMYTVTNGVYSRVNGTLAAGTKYYKLGTGCLTLSVDTEYEDGICLTGTWKFSNNYAYYYVGGKKVTGWYYIERNGSTYKYYFDPDDGHLVTNLYAYFGSSYKYKKCKLVINLNTRNASLLGYDSSTNSYCIPFYSFIIGISKTGKGPQAGNTYALSSNVQKKWFTFADNGTDYYYAYATLISGSGAYLHSERYSTSGNLNTLVASTYNGLGTKQSSMCIRAQLYVAKLVYDVRQCYSGSIKVQVVSNSTYGPFGKITLSSTTGKISSSTKTDPTGSSSYKGYIKQTAE
ncbi:MAG: hypothetical protein LIO70_06795 [Clostridiales bacterium]|nr:hypothetical protein [Clostridiales bacterium]